jgi:hypothetical protein
MRVAKNYSFLFVLLIILIASYMYFSSVHASYSQITSFQACIDAGFTSLPTYPETCKIPGKVFTNELQARKQVEESTVATTTLKDDYKNLSYFLDGQQLQFNQGTSTLFGTSTNPLTFSITNTYYMFEDEWHREYIAFLVQKNDSKKINTYYLASATQRNTASTGLNMILLDTHIASSTFSYASGTLSVVYTTPQSRTKTKYFVLENTILKEVLR